MSRQREQAEAMEHDEMMELHRANTRQAQHGPSPADQARLLDNVVESELMTSDTGLANLRAKDFPLGNYEEGVDAVEFKWVQEILNLFSKSRYPHVESNLQGLSRAWAAGRSGERKGALTPDQLSQDEAYLLGTYSRAMRGEDMAQQETSAKQVTESHAIREGGNSSKGGGLLGRWRD